MGKKRIVAAALLGLAGLVALGCGGKKVDVQVTVDGKPLAGATVSLVLESGGQPISGVSNSDGVATLSGPRGAGVPAGTYKVLVVKTGGMAPTMEKIDPSKAKEMMMKASSMAKSELPGVYGDPKSTPLSLTVPPPTSPAKLELKSKP